MSIVFALVLAAQPAAANPAPDWRPLGVWRGQIDLAWDAASVNRGPDVVTVRLRSEAAQSPRTAEWAISRIEIRCATAMMHVIETITYDPDGAVVRTDNVPQPFQSIPADSFVAIIQRAVC